MTLERGERDGPTAEVRQLDRLAAVLSGELGCLLTEIEALRLGRDSVERRTGVGGRCRIAATERSGGEKEHERRPEYHGVDDADLPCCKGTDERAADWSCRVGRRRCPGGLVRRRGLALMFAHTTRSVVVPVRGPLSSRWLAFLGSVAGGLVALVAIVVAVALPLGTDPRGAEPRQTAAVSPSATLESAAMAGPLAERG